MPEPGTRLGKTHVNSRPAVGWGSGARNLAQHAMQDEPEHVSYEEVRRKLIAGLEKVKRNYQVIAGTPDNVLAQVRTILRILRPGVFIMFSVQGLVGNEERRASMRLFAQEVMPGLREYAGEIALTDPFERTPGSVELGNGKRECVVDREPLRELGLR
jgi:hypothetical protein